MARQLIARPVVHRHQKTTKYQKKQRMSSSDTRAETHVFTPLQRGLGKPRTKAANKPACRQSRLRNARSAFVSRRNAALLLRYTLRLFLLCCALYALYTIGFYLLFRDRLFYSLFIARSLML
jgi:hypothetical protein